MNIFLDLDGVCVDTPEEIEDTVEFWVGLRELPWFRELYAGLLDLGEVYFLTAPSSANAAKGKILWLQDRFGKNFDRYIITCHKHLLSGTGVLIDDRDKHVKAFENAVKFPC